MKLQTILKHRRIQWLFCALWVIAFLFTAGGIASAEEPSAAELKARLESLEQQTTALRAELAQLNAKAQAGMDNVQFQPGVYVVPTDGAVGANADVVVSETTVPQEVSDFVDQKVKGFAWKKGGFTITPYGRLWASVIASTAGFTPNDIVMRILPDDDNTTCSVTFRQTRFGVNIAAPDLPFAPCGSPLKMSGRFEFDFMNINSTMENKSGFQIRHAYWKIENDYGRFLFGQTNDVVAPLFSNIMNYMNMGFAGNIGYRNPQIQLAHYFHPTNCVKIEAIIALAQHCGADFPSNDRLSSWPTIQACLGWHIQRGCNLEPIQFGISGHIGEQRYAFAEEITIRSWSANAYLSVPVTQYMGFQGEFFTGQGLSALCGGVGQSLDYKVATGTGSKRSIHSTGGWAEIWFDLTPNARMTIGSGIDDPLDDDMEAANILLNSVIFANIRYSFTENLRTGLEYSYWRTDYAMADNTVSHSRASVLEWMWQFDF